MITHWWGSSTFVPQNRLHSHIQILRGIVRFSPKDRLLWALEIVCFNPGSSALTHRSSALTQRSSAFILSRIVCFDTQGSSAFDRTLLTARKIHRNHCCYQYKHPTACWAFWQFWLARRRFRSCWPFRYLYEVLWYEVHWYEVTGMTWLGMKWLRYEVNSVWSDWYEVTLVWSDRYEVAWYEVTSV